MRTAAMVSLLALAACDANVNGAADGDAAPCFACVGGGDASGPEEIRFILRTTCANGGVELSCHSVASGGLTLGTSDDFARLVGVRSTERPELLRVDPGRVAESYVYLKLVGDGGIEGGPMPGGLTDPRLIALFGAWIEGGAPDR